jgi:hypothetical protein
LRPFLQSGGSGSLTFDRLAQVPFWTVAVALAAVLVIALAVLERQRPWRAEAGPNFDGLDAPQGRPEASAAPHGLPSAST